MTQSNLDTCGWPINPRQYLSNEDQITYEKLSFSNFVHALPYSQLI